MSIATVLVVIVAVLHVAFAAGETIGWSAFAARFGYSEQKIEDTRNLALNQGAYNLGVAVMLGAAVATDNGSMIEILLGFIVAMAVVGALSVRWTIFVVQGVPAIAALALMMASPADAPVESHVSRAELQHDLSPRHPVVMEGRAWTSRPRLGA